MDDYFIKLMTEWNLCTLTPQHYSLQAGVLFYRGRIHLHPRFSLPPTLLHAHHDALEGGHLGYHKTLHRLKRSFH